MKDAIWIKIVFEDFKYKVNTIIIYEDNLSVISTTIGSEEHATSKHIGFRKQFIREISKYGICIPYYISSKNNIADIFTKPLPFSDFGTFANKLIS